MNFTFNLIDEKWIPCTSDGSFEEVSLRRLFAYAHEIREISCETPIQSAAILPLALAILHRKFGPANTREWGRLWQAKKFDMQTLDSYFAEWHDRFDLFHPKRPFYQVADDRVKPSPVHRHLTQSLKDYNILFSHMTEENVQPLPPAEAARALLQAQVFRLGGGKTGAKTPYAVDSFLSRNIAFFAQGDNMFQTLMLNLIRYPDPSGGFMPHTAQDKPFWERDDSTEGRLIGKEMYEYPSAGYLDYLTWQTNHVRLIPMETNAGVRVLKATLAPVAKFAQSVYSPQNRYSKKVHKGVESFHPLQFQPDKALWRNYHTLLPHDDDDKLPAVIRWCSRLSRHRYLDKNPVIQLMATGMSTKPREAKTNYYRREMVSLPLELLRNKGLIAQVHNAISLAEKTSDKLNFALNILADHISKRKLSNEIFTKNKNQLDKENREKLIKQWNARERYWIELELLFEEFVRLLVVDSEKAIVQWLGNLKSIARKSLNHAINLAGDSPWALKGEIEARRILGRELKQLFEE